MYLIPPLRPLVRHPSPLAPYYAQCETCLDFRVQCYPLRRAASTMSLPEHERIAARGQLEPIEGALASHEAKEHPLGVHPMPPLDMLQSLARSVLDMPSGATARTGSGQRMPTVLSPRESVRTHFHGSTLKYRRE